MEWMCRAAEYPIVLRSPTVERTGSYRRAEMVRYTRAAFRETTRLLRGGRVVLVFPEGYPTVDPTGTRKEGPNDWLPFEPGFLKMIELAERDGTTRVSLVPVGFAYEPGERWTITARIGSPVAREERRIGAIQDAVRRLSAPCAAAQPQTVLGRVGG
jgi:putative membrane protein